MVRIAELDALPPGEAMFDMDGTLITNDIAEACLRGLDRIGHRNRVTDKATSVFAAYEAVLDYQEQCRFAALALGGLRIVHVEELVDAALQAGECTPVAEVCDLAHHLALRHRVWLLTGSPEVLGRIIAERLGIRNVRGIRLRQDGDRLLPETFGILTCDQGKVEAAWAMTGRIPVFAIGDTPHDLPLLRHARVARTVGRIAGREFPALLNEP